MFVREMIKAVTRQSLGKAISTMVSKPLGLNSIEFVEIREHFKKLQWRCSFYDDFVWNPV